MFLVAGVTGNTGSIVATRLLEAGRPVRVLVRSAEKGQSWAARGAEVVVGSLEDANTLARALAGVEGAYLLCPPDMQSKDFIRERSALLDAVAQAVRESRPGHVVFLSSAGAHNEEGTGPIRVVRHGEQVLAATGVPCTLVRPGYFMENWASSVPVAAKEGVLPTFIPRNHLLPMVATRDIGTVSAQALLDGPRGRRVIELAGPKDLTPDDVAATLTELLGRPVTATDVPLDAVVPTFVSLGLSEDVARLYQELFAGVRSGVVGWESPQDVVRGQTELIDVLRPLCAQA